jgi:gliding motility-associated-like protein
LSIWAVFYDLPQDRWGELIFEVQNKTPDNIGGWDGNYKGRASPADAYVYLIKMSFPDGTKQIYKGTVVLVR